MKDYLYFCTHSIIHTTYQHKIQDNNDLEPEQRMHEP